MLQDMQRSPVNNPFTPGFGDADVWVDRVPQLAVVEAMVRRAERGARQAPRLVEHERGYGKTSFLGAVADHAQTWAGGTVIARTTAVQGESFLSTFAVALRDASEMLDGVRGSLTSRLTSALASIRQVRLAGILDVTVQPTGEDMPPSMALRTALEDLATAARNAERPVVFLMDEAQAIDAESLRAVFTALQHVDQADEHGRVPPLAVLLAGLPGTRGQFKTHKVTFGERCRDLPLGPLDPESVRDTLLRFEEFNESGVAFAPDAVELMIEACGGHPHVFQLIGEGAWDASPDGSAISTGDVAEGLERSRAERARIAQARLTGLASQELQWVRAMASLPAGQRTLTQICRAHRDDPSATAAQCGSTANALLSKGVVRQNGGTIAFALSGMDELLG